MGVVTRPGHRTEPDHYFLRGLLHCRPCGELMIPTCTSTGGRYYGCPHRHCPRILVPAAEIEERVWGEFVRSGTDASAGVPSGERHQLLVAALARVTVGQAIDDLAYDWHPDSGRTPPAP
ncbi:zinc ribbon domain-containing protein [Micromonospora sp. NPDC049679]|uniref:zinc ribbon domain-containing protein n=1 Tax=Micromonospora sp. NPDC049679 TaxID=3155920 RepID=UPI0033D48600